MKKLNVSWLAADNSVDSATVSVVGVVTNGEVVQFQDGSRNVVLVVNASRLIAAVPVEEGN